MVDETTGRADASNDKGTGTPGPSAGAPRETNAGAPASAPAPTPQDAAMGNDIAKILKAVKLPEERKTALRGEAERAVPTKDIDALLAQNAAAGESTPQSPAPEQPAAALNTTAAPAPPSTPSVPKGAIQSVHTLKHDLQGVVQDQKISLVRAAALEQDKARPEVSTPRPHTNRVKNAIFIALLLIVLGSSALLGVYIVVQNRSTPLPQTPETSLVFAEQTVSLPLSGQQPAQLKNLLAEARGASTASLGSITRVAPTITTLAPEGEVTRLATLPEFLSAIGANPPEELLRAISQEFFFGLHTVDTNAPFFVIPVLSYDRAFAGMLAWEATINAELAPIFLRVPDLTLDDDALPARRTFTDVVMRNYDVRALADDSGAVSLYYSFPSRGMLIIAESPYTFTELLSRLQAQRKL